jgi:hypothetical protein
LETVLVINSLDPSLVEIFTSDLDVVRRLEAAGAMRERIAFAPDTLRGFLAAHHAAWLVCYHQMLRIRALDIALKARQSSKVLRDKVNRLQRAREREIAATPEALAARQEEQRQAERIRDAAYKRKRRTQMTEQQRIVEREKARARAERQWATMTPEQQEAVLERRRTAARNHARRARAAAKRTSKPA